MLRLVSAEISLATRRVLFSFQYAVDGSIRAYLVLVIVSLEYQWGVAVVFLGCLQQEATDHRAPYVSDHEAQNKLSMSSARSVKSMRPRADEMLCLYVR